MKKYLLAITLTMSLLAASVTESKAQMWSNGNKVSFSYPTGVTGHNTYRFPTWDTVKYSCTVDKFTIAPSALETYLFLDTLKHVNGDNGVKVLSISSANSLIGGEKLWVQTCTLDSVRTMYVNVDGNRVDTITTKSKADVRQYIWNSRTFQKYPY